MLSSNRARDRLNVAPMATPENEIAASPLAARRTSLEERRRPAAKFGKGLSPLTGVRDRASSDHEAQIDEDYDSEADEDDPGERSPLLPIFSAEHLGQVIESNMACLSPRLTLGST